MERWLWPLSVGWRLLNAHSIRTYWLPDETWQSLEPAHYLAFGYGELTWEWQLGIRTAVYPYVLAAIYRMSAAILGNDSELLIHAPYYAMALLAALGDVYTYKLAKRFFGPGAAKYAIIASWANWINAFALARPLANAVEASLVPVSLYWWPWPTLHPRGHWSASTRWNYVRSLLVAALCCAMRPTVGVLYVPLGVHLLAHFRRARLQILAAAAAVGAVTAAVTMVTDHAFYGRWILTPWAFVRFNVTSGLSRVYGVHPWYWYFVAGLPINIAGFLPFFLHGICRASSRALLLCILWVTAAYSALAHKEHRFLFCVLQPMYCYVGVSLHRLLHDKHRKRAQWTRAVLGILVVLNLAGVYVGNMVHGTGMIDVIHALRHELRRHGTDTADVGVLSSCHSTPAYSHLHAKVPMWSLGCPPPLEPDVDIDSFKTETDWFHEDERAFVQKHLYDAPSFRGTYPWPVYLIVSETAYLRLKDILDGKGYVQLHEFPTSPFFPPSDSRYRAVRLLHRSARI